MIRASRFVILYSSTGGGHRSVAEAIRESLGAENVPAAAIELVDGLLDYGPGPLRRLPAWYPYMVGPGAATLWGIGFRLSDGPRRTRLFFRALWPYIRRPVTRLVKDHPADVLVSTHPLLTSALAGMPRKDRPPLVSISTDLVSVHAAWFPPAVEVCLVPTPQALEKALRCGISSERAFVTGLPVAAAFRESRTDRRDLRARFGWDPDLPAALVCSGGDGVGPIYEIAHRVSEAALRCQLALVAGRNRPLYDRLHRTRWSLPVYTYGFVSEMAEMMAASDFLITKAGPGTISEGLNMGVPLILHSRIPGQEQGNVGYVVEHGAGVWAPGADRVVAALRRWLDDPAAVAQAAANARSLARPDAARDAARILIEIARRRSPSAE